MVLLLLEAGFTSTSDLQSLFRQCGLHKSVVCICRLPGSHLPCNLDVESFKEPSFNPVPPPGLISTLFPTPCSKANKCTRPDFVLELLRLVLCVEIRRISICGKSNAANTLNYCESFLMLLGYMRRCTQMTIFCPFKEYPGLFGLSFTLEVV